MQIESFRLIYDACYYHFGLLIIKYSRGSFCDYREELEREYLLSGSKSRSTRFDLIRLVRPLQSRCDRLSSMMGRYSFFAIKPSFHFYLYFTVRKCLIWPNEFWCFRSRLNEAWNMCFDWFEGHLIIWLGDQYFERLVSYCQLFSDIALPPENLIVTFIFDWSVTNRNYMIKLRKLSLKSLFNIKLWDCIKYNCRAIKVLPERLNAVSKPFIVPYHREQLLKQ